MRKRFLLAAFLFIGCILFISFAKFTNKETKQEFIRIHIRANSDDPTDQEVKFAVKEEIVGLLTPLIAGAKDRQEVYKIIGNNLGLIQSAAERILLSRGYGYGAKAAMKTEEFPHRVYGEWVLERGVYDALIVELGEGKGDNWWCVIYPPLCFLGADGEGDGVVYKSKIAELIDKFKRQNT